jgi:hypothetical protein
MTKQDISKRASSRKVAKPWRDVLKIHPAALQYPRLTEAELCELGKDIAARGLQVNIVLIREGDKDLLLDGVSRLDALEANGVNLVAGNQLDPTLGLGGGSRVRVVSGIDPYALAASLNAHRRHLTVEQKRERIETLVKQNPEKSNRQIAKEAKTNHKIVGRARKRLESTGTVSRLEKRTGADGKSCKQPSRRLSSKSDDIGNVPPLNQAVADVVGSTGERGKAAVSAPDTGPENGELARLRAQIEKLKAEKRELEIRAEGMQSEIAELKAARPATLFDALRAALAIAEREGASAALRRGIQNMIADLTKLPPDDLAIPEFLRRDLH